MNRALLEKPFERDEIKQREGNFGKTLDYVEGHSIIQRLNDGGKGSDLYLTHISNLRNFLFMGKYD
jgi:hypothetical protein